MIKDEDLLKNNMYENLFFWIVNSISLLWVICLYRMLFFIEISVTEEIVMCFTCSLLTNFLFSLGFDKKILLIIPAIFQLSMLMLSVGTLIYFGTKYDETNYILNSQNMFSLLGHSLITHIKENNFLMDDNPTFCRLIFRNIFCIEDNVINNPISYVNPIRWFSSFIMMISCFMSFNYFYYKNWSIFVIINLVFFIFLGVSIYASKNPIYIEEYSMKFNVYDIFKYLIYDQCYDISKLKALFILSLILLILHITYIIILKISRKSRFIFLKQKSFNFYIIWIIIGAVIGAIAFIIDNFVKIIVVIWVCSCLGFDFSPLPLFFNSSNNKSSNNKSNREYIDSDGNYFDPETDFFKYVDGKYYKKGDYIKDANGNYYRAFEEPFVNWDGQYVKKGDSYKTQDNKYHIY